MRGPGSVQSPGLGVRGSLLKEGWGKPLLVVSALTQRSTLLRAGLALLRDHVYADFSLP